MLNVRDFGAKGNGQADDTQPVQKALNEAADTRASVFVPEGTYLCSTITVPPNTGLLGNPTWDYRHSGGAILRLCDEKAPCLIDITGAFGATLAGLCLEGRKLRQNLHGVWLNKPDCHIRLECVHGAVVSGNSLSVGRDDGGKGHWSPGTAIILRGMKNSIVKDNVMHEGSLRQLVLDLVGHSGETIIRDNVGSLAEIPTA